MADDLSSRVYGMGNSAVLTHLLHVLIKKGGLTRAEAERILSDAEQELAAHGTVVAAGGIGIVQTIRQNLNKP